MSHTGDGSLGLGRERGVVACTLTLALGGALSLGSADLLHVVRLVVS